MNVGTLVSDDIINNLIENVISNKEHYNKIIFDGYPRNLSQAENLNRVLLKYNQQIDIVISLKVSLDTIKKRITGRLVCSKCSKIYNEFFSPPSITINCCDGGVLQKREDDNDDVAVKRYETYEKSTEPVLEFYKKKNLVKDLNGELNIESIQSKISDYLALIEG